MLRPSSAGSVSSDHQPLSVYTLHFTAVWGGMVLWSASRLKDEMDGGVWGLGLVVWCLWSGLQGLYLKWWFMESGAEARMGRQLAGAYGLPEANDSSSIPPQP